MVQFLFSPYHTHCHMIHIQGLFLNGHIVVEWLQCQFSSCFSESGVGVGYVALLWALSAPQTILAFGSAQIVNCLIQSAIGNHKVCHIEI